MPSRSVMSVLLLGAALSQVAAQTVVYEAGEPGLEPPQLIENTHVQPVYPEQALQDGVQGTVLLRVVVTAEGMVGNVEVFRSPFRGESLAQAALDAVRQWRYQPARLQGRNVACRIMQTVSFYPARTKPPKKPGRRARSKKAPPPPRSVKAVESAPAVVEATPVPAPPAAAEEQPEPPAPPAAAEEKPEPVPATPVAAEEQPEPAPTIPVAAEEKPDPVDRDEPAPSAPPPAPRPSSPAAIDIRSGGPQYMLLGQPGVRAREILGGAAKRDGGNVLRLFERGIEVTLAASPDGEEIVAIRYLFTPGEGFSASGLRTRKGLGRGSFCMGIIPAYGRPEERQESTDGNGNALLSLVYRRDGTLSRFVCRDGRLVELTLAREPG